MAQKARKYTKEFKEEALKMLEELDCSQAEIAWRLGIPLGSLTRWKREKRLSSNSPAHLQQYKDFLALQKENKRFFVSMILTLLERCSSYKPIIK